MVDNEDCSKLLHQAALFDNVELMESLLLGASRCSIDDQDSYGRTPLYTSITNNSLTCCHLLLMAGANPNIQCGPRCNGMTALHIASKENKKQFVDLLLEYNADSSVVDKLGRMPIDVAIENNCTECIESLQMQLDINLMRKSESEEEFAKACQQGNVHLAKEILHSYHLNEKLIKTIINHNPDDGHQHDFLYSACRSGNKEMCEFLLRYGAEVRVEKTSCMSSVHISCLTGNTQCLQLLLEAFPQHANTPTLQGSYPIHLVCRQNVLEVVKILVDTLKRTSPEPLESIMNMKDSEGLTPLHLAVKSYSIEITRYLFTITNSPQICEDPSTQDGSGESIWESTHGNDNNVQKRDLGSSVKRVSSLTSSGVVRVDEIDNDGRTALHMAIEKCTGPEKFDYYEIIKILLQNKANPNLEMIIKLQVKNTATSTSSTTTTTTTTSKPSKSATTYPLIEATKLQDIELIDLLLSHGARDDSMEAIKMAIKLNNDKIIGQYLSNISFYDQESRPLLNKRINLEVDDEVDDALTDKKQVKIKLEKFASALLGLRLDWSGMGLTKLCMNWLLMVGKKYLNKNVPKDIQRFNVLCNSHLITRIDVSRNSITKLPSFLFHLPSLKKLDASSNKIERISFTMPQSKREVCTDVNRKDATSHSDDSEEFDEDSMSVSTTISTSKQKDEPLTSPVFCADYFKDSMLEEINLQSNILEHLPTELFKLPQLKRLNASYNKLSRVPYEVWMCSTLVELKLSHNFLADLSCPSESASLAHRYLCRSTSGLFANNSVFIEGNTKMSETKFALKGDSSLNVDNKEKCLLNSSDDNISNDIIYRRANRWHDKIKLQPSFYEESADDDDDSAVKSKLKKHQAKQSAAYKLNQSRLKLLDLSFNLFEEVPNGLSCLAYRLEKLILTSNQLSKLGPIHCYPATLQVLDLTHNHLSYDDRLLLLTPTRPQLNTSNGGSVLKMCKSPFCGYNPTTGTGTPPQPTSRLTSRSSTSNLTSSLPNVPLCDHASHTQLLKLKTLSLSHNCLVSFDFCYKEESKASSPRLSLKPPKLYFPGLLSLDMSHNIMTSVPKDVSYFEELTSLNLANNKIKELPCEIGSLRKLWSLNFSGNPVEDTLKCLLGEKMRTVSSVVSYLRAIRDEAVPYSHMKLMIVGKQGIGKTSLLNMLTGNKDNKSHWGSRMDGTMKTKDMKGADISTVGVDIGELVLTRHKEEVNFSTWDFGGQREYYATHQYFLSKRSIYLVVWRLTDGTKGVNNIFKWLINIQARAPNSAVLIVGTHVDVVKKNHPAGFLDEMKNQIERKYINVEAPERWGFPKVIGHLEVTCKINHRPSIQALQDMIWKAVDLSFDKQGVKLLDQKVPVSYVRLQNVVKIISQKRRQANKDPVLHADQYKHDVIELMESTYGTSFQNASELNQATQFLHENGMLLHYDDTNLRDIYFLDAQWLCDMLACIVTVKEVNRLSCNGVMKIEDLPMLFKGISFKSEDIKKYMINLLHKFEVALQWDMHHLLIPSLLPADKQGGRKLFVEIPLTIRGDKCMSSSIQGPTQPLFNSLVSCCLPPTSTSSATTTSHLKIHSEPPPSTTTKKLKTSMKRNNLPSNLASSDLSLTTTTTTTTTMASSSSSSSSQTPTTTISSFVSSSLSSILTKATNLPLSKSSFELSSSSSTSSSATSTSTSSTASTSFITSPASIITTTSSSTTITSARTSVTTTTTLTLSTSTTTTTSTTTSTTTTTTTSTTTTTATLTSTSTSTKSSSVASLATTTFSRLTSFIASVTTSSLLKSSPNVTETTPTTTMLPTTNPTVVGTTSLLTTNATTSSTSMSSTTTQSTTTQSLTTTTQPSISSAISYLLHSKITRNINPALSFFRLYTMSYIPAGFWPRLITRLLGDATYSNLLKSLYDVHKIQSILTSSLTTITSAAIIQATSTTATTTPATSTTASTATTTTPATSTATTTAPPILPSLEDLACLLKPEWRCWQSGLELCYLGFPVMRVKELSSSTTPGVFDYTRFQCVVREDTDYTWNPVFILDESILEIVIFNETFDFITFDDDVDDDDEEKEEGGSGWGDTELGKMDGGHLDSGGFESLEASMDDATTTTTTTTNDVVTSHKGNNTSASAMTSSTDSRLTLKSNDAFHGRKKLSSKVTFYPSEEIAVRLLSTVVEQIDILLEDWYPNIGTRFTKDFRGLLLINRLVPCNHCLIQQKLQATTHEHSSEDGLSCNSREFESSENDDDVEDECLLMMRSGVAGDRVGGKLIVQRRKSTGALRKGGGGGGGRSDESPNLLQTSFLKKQSNLELSPYSYKNMRKQNKRQSFSSDVDAPLQVVYCFSFEQCIQIAQQNKIVSCPRHGNLGPFYMAGPDGLVHFGHVAPDTAFYDLRADLLVNPDNLHRSSFLGKGAFGSVFSGYIDDKKTNERCPVAMKLLQPVVPDEDLEDDVLRLIKKDVSMWTREPALKCCEAYNIARKELSILLYLQHQSVVSLVGVCVSPLSLILSLAPMGSLNSHLKNFAKVGLQLPMYSIRDVIIQVASALDYLHFNQIIYRDLKSDNILVWSFPSCNINDTTTTNNNNNNNNTTSFSDDYHIINHSPVDVKLADYGVSRVVLPTGTKGLAGTLPFMAPEIILHNGEEAYTEKVDCYSFALMMYELLTLKFPYENDAFLGTCRLNLKSHILAGGRPLLSAKDTTYPTNVLDLMTSCWASDPHDRLSTQQIEFIARQPEFSALLSAVTFNEEVVVEAACAATCFDDMNRECHEVLMYGRSPAPTIHSTPVIGQSVKRGGALYVCSYFNDGGLQIKKLPIHTRRVTCLCCVGDFIWSATHVSNVIIYRTSDYTEVGRFQACEAPTGVCHIFNMGSIVCLLLNDGTFIFCRSHFGLKTPQCDDTFENEDVEADNNVDGATMDFSDVILCKHPGNNRMTHCIVAIKNKSCDIQLWCGQTQATVVAWRCGMNEERYQELNHSNNVLEHLGTFNHFVKNKVKLCDTVQIAYDEDDDGVGDDDDDMMSVKPVDYLFTYVYPGSKVYKWSLESRLIIDDVDVLQGTPTTPAGGVDGKYFCITSMKVLSRRLYIGTSAGSLSCFQGNNLKPVFVCAPYTMSPHNMMIVPVLRSDDRYDMPSATNETHTDSIEHHSGAVSDEEVGFISYHEGEKCVVEGVTGDDKVRRNSKNFFITIGIGYKDLVEVVASNVGMNMSHQQDDKKNNTNIAGRVCNNHCSILMWSDEILNQPMTAGLYHESS